MSGAAVVVMQNRYLRRFGEAGATDPARAVTLEELGCRSSFVFKRMVALGVFVPIDDNRYYMDQSAANAFIRRRRRIAMVFVAVMAVLAIISVIFLIAN
jgi:hypothetical protein